MADRQDIDALLVGAVYGELDAAERARLDAHLSSHPEDRAELESLEATRAQVRRSIATLPDAEPSPNISALLLKAAEGGVPAAKPAVEPQEESLWARFVAWLVPVTRHPAFAAATVLVLVAGAASAWWLGGGKVAEPEVKSPAAASSNQSVVIGGAGSGSGSASGSAAPM